MGLYGQFILRVRALYTFTNATLTRVTPGERVGAFSVICETAEEAARVLSQVFKISFPPKYKFEFALQIHPIYSSPPIHGARIATRILTDPELYEQW